MEVGAGKRGEEAGAQELVQDLGGETENRFSARSRTSGLDGTVKPENFGEDAEERPPVQEDLDPATDQAREEPRRTSS